MPALGAALLSTLLTLPVIGQEGVRAAEATSEQASAATDRAFRGERDNGVDLDVPPATPQRLLPGVYIGGGVDFEYEAEENYDLDDRIEDDLGEIESAISVALTVMPNNYLMAFLSLDLSRKFDVTDEAGVTDNVLRLRVKRAYIEIRDLIKGLTLTAGRQRIKDEREWYYDDTFDAVRLEFERGPFELQGAIGREEFEDNDLLNGREVDRINTYLMSGLVEVFDDIELSGHAIYRDDRAEEEGRVWYFGLRTEGEIEVFDDDEIDFWIDLAMRHGGRDGVDLYGYAFDIGATYTFDVLFDPHFTVAVAHGSGDKDPDDDDETEFRQTGLEDNQGRFGGVTRFKYYGEIFDPDLRNLHIYTAGAGLRPTRNSSIDLIYHYFRQDVLSDRLRGSPIELDPNEDPYNMSKSLGHEVDLIIGVRDILPNLDVDLTAGYFVPGDAFRIETAPDAFDHADNAFFAGVEISLDLP